LHSGVSISDAEIAAMIKGADLTVSMQSLRKESVPFTLPVFKAPPGLSSGADGPANRHWLFRYSAVPIVRVAPFHKRLPLPHHDFWTTLEKYYPQISFVSSRNL
jgi:hypothetical protein